MKKVSKRDGLNLQRSQLFQAKMIGFARCCATTTQPSCAHGVMIIPNAFHWQNLWTKRKGWLGHIGWDSRFCVSQAAKKSAKSDLPGTLR